jgi:predicted alpha/beta-hydrolase family hydrolase
MYIAVQAVARRLHIPLVPGSYSDQDMVLNYMAVAVQTVERTVAGGTVAGGTVAGGTVAEGTVAEGTAAAEVLTEELY